MLTPYGVGVSISVRVLGRPFFAIDSTHAFLFFKLSGCHLLAMKLLFNLKSFHMKFVEILASIIVIVWGILNIVLFFKIWKATRHIADIKMYCENRGYNLEPNELVLREIMRNNPDVEKILFDSLYGELCCNYHNGGNMRMVIDRYKILYKRANVAFPERF